MFHLYLSGTRDVFMTVGVLKKKFSFVKLFVTNIFIGE